MPEKQFVQLPNGETYAYLEQSAGEDVFLLIHATLSSSVHYVPLFGLMRNVRLIAPDLRGFGDSSYCQRFSTMLELAEDLKLFMDALGVSKAHVVGWSTGTGAAMELAVQYPEMVRSLFMIEGAWIKGFPLFRKHPDGTSTPYATKDDFAADPELMAPALAALEKHNAAYINLIWKDAVYTRKKPSMKENKLYLSEIMKQRSLLDTEWALAHFNMSHEHNGYTAGSGAIEKIRCPVAFTCAELDTVVTPAITRENAAAIPGSQLLEYAQCGHSPMVDCPERLAADILAHAGIVST